MYRRKRWALPALATLSLLAAGCGGSPHHSAATPVIKPPLNTPRAAIIKAKVVNQHVCNVRDYNLACPLPVASVATIARGVDPVTQGVDFGWSCPVGSARDFGVSYLSYDTSKDWTLSCIRAFHAQGKATAAVWETGASRATEGYNAGYSDARVASARLVALGAPSGQPFTLAIDCDCAGSSLVGYFQGANAAEPGRVNAYGGYYQLAYLYARHLVGHLNWQTYAWSRGLWLPANIAPLEQYLNSSAVDYDRAIATDYGQWPRPAPPKPPGPSHAQVRGWISIRGKSLHAYYVHRCRRPVLTTGTCGQLGWRVDHFQKLIDTNHGYYPRCFGRHANKAAAECQIVRPAVAVWSAARSSTSGAGFSLGCQGIATWGLPKSSRACKALNQRYGYFDHRANRTVSTSRY